MFLSLASRLVSAVGSLLGKRNPEEVHDPLEPEKKKKIEEEEAKKKMETIDAIKKKKDGEFLDPRNAKFKLEELQGKFPKGVDPIKKELYLSSEDFKKHFGMTLTEYVKLGAFQKKKLKKQLDLF